MYELTGNIRGDILYAPRGQAIISLELNEKLDALKMFDELHEAEKLTIKFDAYREKRSLNANNYAWHLLTQIGNKLRISKEEAYFLMLKRYGQSEMISVVASIDISGYVKYFEEAGESELKGKLFKHYKVYKGSSEFDTEEMSIFLDGVVSEAKDLGIQTETPEQIARIKSLWGE